MILISAGAVRADVPRPRETVVDTLVRPGLGAAAGLCSIIHYDTAATNVWVWSGWIPGDRVGVVAFAGRDDVISPLAPLEEWDGLRRRLLALRAGGGTRITPAVEAAADLFTPPQKGDTKVRHLMLLSDGRSKDFDAARRDVESVELALIGFAVARVGFVILVVAIVTDVGVPMPIIVGQPHCKGPQSAPTRPSFARR